MQEVYMENNTKSIPLFEATLYPHRSLPPQVFWWLMAGIAGVSFTTGLVFASIGAWPIMGFFGLDVLFFFIAFRLNYRSGRLLETVRLTREELLIRRIHPSGMIEEWRLEPYWLRVNTVPTAEEIGTPQAEIRLSSHGKTLSLGRFLTDNERTDFSNALNSALSRCRAKPGQY
ncbi:MAG: DUF2244 domain-containing protein [Rhodospirillales bacterium]|jgi:uncharacterized membrane protein